MQKHLRNEAYIEALGITLKELRLQKHMTQMQLGAAAQITASQITRVELGTFNTGISHLVAISAALGLKPHELLRIVDDRLAHQGELAGLF